MSQRQINALIAALAILTLASGSRALLAGTCGDYLQHNASGQAAAAKSAMPAQEDAPLFPKPCSGPRCSQAPVSPASLPAPAPTTPGETRGQMILQSTVDEPIISCSFWRTTIAQQYLYVAAEDIFHPPRLA